MSKEKNKNTFRVAALLLVACLISSVMLSGTFAKYTSEYAGQDTALVARWDLTMTDGETAFSVAPAVATLDLFSHLYDTNILSTAGTEKIIAPGVSGDFVLSLTNNSDVAADITFDITEADGNPSNPRIPMEFSIVDNFETTGKILNGVDALENALNIEAIHLGHTNGNANRTVYWRWAYDNTGKELMDYYGVDNGNPDEDNPGYIDNANEADTALGVASASGASRTKYTLNIKVIATQSVPANFTMGAISGLAKSGVTLQAGSLSGPAGLVDPTANLQWQRSNSRIWYFLHTG
jgi:hypothetical protein